jgi:hypothetical protein
MNQYEQTQDAICKYYGVTSICASYLYHRSFRSRRSDDKYLQWTIKLQNAIVIADKCLGMEWNNLKFNEEEYLLLTYGIDVQAMDNETFRWESEEPADEWTVVIDKRKEKKKRNNLSHITRSGLIL